MITDCAIIYNLLLRQSALFKAIENNTERFRVSLDYSRVCADTRSLRVQRKRSFIFLLYCADRQRKI